jgi:hypothetical protein
MYAPLTVRCEHCPDWTAEGDASSCIEAQRQHIAEAHGIHRDPKIETTKRTAKRAALEEAFETYVPIVLDMLADGPIRKIELEGLLCEQGMKRSHMFKMLDSLQAKRLVERVGGVGAQPVQMRLVEDAA